MNDPSVLNPSLNRSLVVAASTALITLLGVVLSGLTTQWIIWVASGAIGLAGLSLLTAIFGEYVASYRAARISSARFELLERSVPTLIRFRSRADRLEIDAQGNGLLRWSFDIETGSDQESSTLEFPIFTESVLDLTAMETRPNQLPVEVRSVSVDGRDRTLEAVLSYEELRISPNTDHMVEYGKLAIPVQLDEGRTRAQLEIELFFAEVWSPAGSDQVDFFLVDVPYVTETLEVLIVSTEKDLVIAPPIGGGPDQRSVVARSAIMGTFDGPETEDESRSLKSNEGQITWASESPKLGYRYQLNFRVLRLDPQKTIAAAVDEAAVSLQET